jgi:hypothetical protein
MLRLGFLRDILVEIVLVEVVATAGGPLGVVGRVAGRLAGAVLISSALMIEVADAGATPLTQVDQTLSFPESGACISTHLREAIQINRERRPLYSARTSGQSVSISANLILLERQMLILAPLLDRYASKYHEAGIPVFCQDLMPMTLTPEYAEGYPDGAPELTAFLPISAGVIRRDLSRGLRSEGLAGIEREALKWLHHLEAEPRFHCLTRHFLESTIRSARLADKYDRRAKRLGVDSPLRLMTRYLRLSLTAFGAAVDIDLDAAPLQAANVPIICQDIPAIPLDSDWEP